MTPFCTVPGEPKELMLKVLNETAVRLSWAPPDSPNGVILDYEVIYYGYKLVECNKVTSIFKSNVFLFSLHYCSYKFVCR